MIDKPQHPFRTWAYVGVLRCKDKHMHALYVEDGIPEDPSDEEIEKLMERAVRNFQRQRG